MVDEWHELAPAKEELKPNFASQGCKWNPNLRTCRDLSATLGNLENTLSSGRYKPEWHSCKWRLKKEIRSSDFDSQRYGKISVGRTLGGQIGKMLPDKEKQIYIGFTNVRSQTEYWFHALLSVRPEWERWSIHHGSLDRKDRTVVEDRLRNPEIKAVVCTSSLDARVDFSPVEQVIQIGGPGGLTCGTGDAVTNQVPLAGYFAFLLKRWNWWNTLRQGTQWLLEKSEREPLHCTCLDLHAQHLITLALGVDLRKRIPWRKFELLGPIGT